MSIKTKSIQLTNIPTRVRLFKTGENESSKGTVIYDATKKLKLKANQFINDGRDRLPIDIAHMSLKGTPSPEAHISVGWFKLKFEDDGIYATDIEWTERGLNFLKNREFRFISPAFFQNENGEIQQIVNMSLTNEPATFHPIPLVADKQIIVDDDIQKKAIQFGKKEKRRRIMSDTNIENKEQEQPEQVATCSAENEKENASTQLENEEKTEKKDTPTQLAEEDDDEENNNDDDSETVDVPEEEKDELIKSLRSQVENLQGQLAEAKELIGKLESRLEEMEQEKEQAEKDSVLNEAGIEGKEKEILSALPLEKVKELSKVRKDAKHSKAPDSPSTSDDAPESDSKPVEDESEASPALDKKAPESGARAPISDTTTRTLDSLPTLEEIRQLAEKYKVS